MLPAMRLVAPLAAGFGLAIACGGSVGGDLTKDGGSGGGISGSGGSTAGTGGWAAFGGTGGTGFGGVGGKDAGLGGSGGYVDPGCPDAAPPPPMKECDPFAKPTGCPGGEACYPFVQYPQKKCDQEIFGTFCAPGGTGKQGDPCGGSLCAGGHVCVITGVGTQCVQLCPLTGEDGCPAGLFCVPIDVEGFGGCF